MSSLDQVVAGRMDHLKCCGRFRNYNVFSSYPQTTTYKYRYIEPVMETLPSGVLQPLLDKCGDFYRASPSRVNVEISFKKLDVVPVYDFYDDPYYSLAFNMVFTVFQSLFSRSYPWNAEQIMASIEMNAAAGFIWSQNGIKKKIDFFKNDSCVNYLFDEDMFLNDVIWKVIPKIEWKHYSDLIIEKIRTFIIGPVETIYYGKMIYGEQNILMKEFWWSAYGFNPYCGGTHELGLLLEGSLVLIYDVKGWDRKLPLLKDIYKIRNHHVPSDLLYIAQWFAKTLIKSYIVHPDGHLYCKESGNNSGSNNTTNDNIIGHCIIFSHFLFRLFKGDISQITRVICKLFGDDNISGFPMFTLKDSQYVKSVLVDTFALYGLELDPIEFYDGPVGASFLGFKIDKWESFYIPVFDQSRLLASFCYTFEKNNDLAFISKSWTLAIMAAGGDKEVFDDMCLSLEHLCIRFKNNTDPTIAHYVSSGPPTFEQCMRFYCGFEAVFNETVVGGIMNTWNNAYITEEIPF